MHERRESSLDASHEGQGRLRGGLPPWCLLTLAFAAWSEVARGEDLSEDAAVDQPSVQLSLREEYRLRKSSQELTAPTALGEPAWQGETTDQDLSLFGDGVVSAYGERLQLVASGALYYDLDGTEPEGSPSLFARQSDGEQPLIVPYALSGEWRGKVLEHVRVGRQSSEHGLPLVFDGGSVGLRPAGRDWLVFGFGGRTVHFFEAEPEPFETWVASLGTVVRLEEAVKLEVDGRLVRDRVEDMTTLEPSLVTNRSYGARVVYRAETISASVAARGIDEQASHGTASFGAELPSLELALSARLHLQFVTLREIAESENPQYTILGESLPYARFAFAVEKGLELGELTRLSVSLGWRARQLFSAEPRRFNRNTGCFSTEARLTELGVRHLFLGGQAELWYVPGSDIGERELTWGAMAGYDGSRVKTELGTYYQQYRVRYYQVAEELLNTRSVYASVGLTLLPWLEVRGRYDFDIMDRYLQTVTLSLGQEL